MSETAKGNGTASKRGQKAVAKGSTKEAVMYIGPNVNGVAVKGTVYKNGKLPDLLKRKIEELPVFSAFLVPVSELTQTTKDLRDPKSAISTCYANAVEELEKGVKR